MNIRHWTALPAAFLIALAGTQAFAQGTLTTLISNGPTSNRINVVILSEGYQSNQLGQFLVDATNAANNLLTAPPLAGYRSYFNAFAISVASAQSGSDHYTPSIALVNTYFNSTFDSYGLQRLITIPPNDRDPSYANGRGKVDALLQSLLPEYDLVVLMVNDTQYGGSGGSVLVSSVNSSSAEIVRHESGHTFAGLTDEYSSAYPGWTPVEYPNATSQTNRSLISWTGWISGGTPVPTPAGSPYLSVVGLFLGAEYQAANWYRPKYDCKMNHLGVSYCEVCAQEIVKSIYRKIRLIDSATPTGTNVALLVQDSAAFSLIAQVPATNTLSIQWMTNSLPVTGATQSNFVVSAQSLGLGNHIVSVQVSDVTALVRNDPTHLLRATNAWMVSVSGTLPPSITAQPSNQAVAVGSGITFSVAAGGTTPLGYQWKRNGSNIVGATSSAYSKPSVQPADAGSYTVVVSNTAGSVVSATATLAVNSTPLLAPITTRTIHAGTTLTLTNAATDGDAPPQTLTFSLDPGAPAGATVSPSNGVFIWSSSAAQSGTTNLVTVRVADNGTPPLSDAKSFTIAVVGPLKASSITRSNTTLTITWGAIPGRTYRVEYKNDLRDSQWQVLAPDVVAPGPVVSKTDVSGERQRFYRIVLY